MRCCKKLFTAPEFHTEKGLGKTSEDGGDKAFRACSPALLSLSIRGSNPVALKGLFFVSSGVFLLAIQKYWRVEETPYYLKTKAFRVLRSFKMSYFCRYKEKNEAMLSPCEAF